MANKKLHLYCKTPTTSFWFEVSADPKYLEEWRSHGIVIDEICNTAPELIVSAGLLKPWIFLQDIFNFKWPWSNK